MRNRRYLYIAAVLAWLAAPALPRAALARETDGLIRGVSSAGALDGGRARIYRENRNRQKKAVADFLSVLPVYLGFFLPVAAVIYLIRIKIKFERQKRGARRGLEAAIKSKIGALGKTETAAEKEALGLVGMMFRQWLHLNGDPRTFSVYELPYIAKAISDLEPMARLFSALSGIERLRLAATLLELNEPEKSADLLDSAAVGAAGAIEDGYAVVVRIYETAGRLDEFIARRCGGLQPVAYSAYAGLLMKTGKYPQALRLLNLSPKLLASDLPLLFELHIRLGGFPQAETMLKEVLWIKPFQRESPGAEESLRFYYELALLCEVKGGNKLAGEIYGLFIDSGTQYRDVKERYDKLRELAGEKLKPAPAPAPLPRGADRPAASPAPKNGWLDGKYELKQEIGAGGMGIVYEGWDHNLNRKVAVKKMRSELKAYPKERKRFLQEAATVAHLSHPYIVGIHAIIEENAEVYLVFDYVEGKTLSNIIEEKKQLTLRDCKEVLGYVCLAVNYAHKKNILHRDLKPANIIIDSNNFAKVMDFGLASELRDGLTSLTQQTVIGTPNYMAPEQYRGVAKPETDIYALGVCLYEMLTGDLPFKGLETLAAKERKIYRDVSLILPWAPAKIDKIIGRALEPDPNARFGDAMSFYRELDHL